MNDWVRLEFTDSSKKLCAKDYTNLEALRIAQGNYLYDFLINYTSRLSRGAAMAFLAVSRIISNDVDICLFLQYGTLAASGT